MATSIVGFAVPVGKDAKAFCSLECLIPPSMPMKPHLLKEQCLDSSARRKSMARYAIITREFTFEAAHHLPGHRGKCRRPHGHSYRLQVSLRGPIIEAPGQSDHGMVMDFEDLKRIVDATILEHLVPSVPRGDAAEPIENGGMDHNDLNALTGIRTTAENLVH